MGQKITRNEAERRYLELRWRLLQLQVGEMSNEDLEIALGLLESLGHTVSFRIVER